MNLVNGRHWDVSIVGSQIPTMPPPGRCPRCDAEIESGDLHRRLYVCDCGHHFPLSADAWIALLADSDTWCEHWTDLKAANVLHWASPVPYEQALQRAEAAGLNESVRVGSCALGGAPLWLAVFDFRFLGGTLSIVSGERLARAMEAAIASQHRRTRCSHRLQRAPGDPAGDLCHPAR